MGWKVNEVYNPAKRRRIAAALQASVGDMCHEEFGAGGNTETTQARTGENPIVAASGSATRDRLCVSRAARPFVSTDEAKLNKTESAFLAWLRQGSERRWIGIQNITLKLADDTRYTPDFWSGYTNREECTIITAWEVKGFWRDDARVKIQVAARMFPWARFVAVQRVKGEWKFEEIKP